jgi:NAD(P)-dependent dehydrogenase (short-subunit alcohol dehydrogenase family)
MTLLREELLAGRAIALAGGVSQTVADALGELGARTEALDAALDEDRAREWASGRAPFHALVYDAGSAFGAGGPAGLSKALEQGWVGVRALATGALISDEQGGKIVLIGPRSDAGTFASAARAALENTARTLSVEWARYAITATMIAPGAATTDQELAELVCFLVSPAGDYLSGCRFELAGLEGER